MSNNLGPGILKVTKVYNSVMAIILRERGQTQAEAAKKLGISVSTFQKIFRLKGFPNFHTGRGKLNAQRFERWSTLPIQLLFPEVFGTKEFLEAPKTFSETRSLHLIMKDRKRLKKRSTLALPASSAAGGKKKKKARKQRR